MSICVSIGSYTDTFHPIVDKIADSLGYKQLQYAVVIDAGSTGSRVIAYQFHLGYLDGRLVLDRELFVEVKPGLSFYHDKPAKVIQIYSLTQCNLISLCILACANVVFFTQ